VKIAPWKKKAIKRIAENLRTMSVSVNMLNPSTGVSTQHFFRDVFFEVLHGSEFRVYSDVSWPLNRIRIPVRAIKEITVHNPDNYSIVMKDDTSITICRDFYR